MRILMPLGTRTLFPCSLIGEDGVLSSARFATRFREFCLAIDIRSASVDDASAIQGIYAPIVVEIAISFEEVPPTVEEMADRIVRTSRTHPYLVAVKGGKVCGYAYA